MTLEESKELKEKAICAECVGETYLSSRIRAEGQEDKCSFCGEVLSCITLEDLADCIEAAFETHFSRTSDEPNLYESMMLRDKESDYDWERDGQQTVYAIMDAANISEEVARDVQAILGYRHFDFDDAAMGGEAEFSEEAHYEDIMPRDRHWEEAWDDFEKQIKTEARFFSRSAAEHLGSLFDHIDEMRTTDGRSLIKDAGPGTEITHLYRGRVFQSEDPLKKAIQRPDLELSAPPASAAASGRMNAKGISVFYGATSPEIVLAEVRPPVGSSVALARFEIIRPLRLLDLAALEDVVEDGSIFDPQYAHRLGRMMFLRNLSSKMSRPVMPDDQEMEYLPTQAIADYLSTEGKVPLDGILFPSVQVGGNGVNTVLFHKASRCEKFEIPDGTKIESDTYSIDEDGYYPDFYVREMPPVAEEGPKEDRVNRICGSLLAPTSYWDDWHDANCCVDLREMALRVELESLQVHIVNSIQIATQRYPVRRHRFEERNDDF